MRPETCLWSVDSVKLTPPTDHAHRFTVAGTLYNGTKEPEYFYWRVPLHDRSNWERYDFTRAEWTPDALAEYRRLYPERALVLIPPAEDDRRLRHVEIDGRYRLILWDTYRQSTPGRAVLGYAFWDTTDEREAPLFIGEDFGPSPLHGIDSDASILALLTFLTYTPESDSRFTDRQREWFDSSECAELSCNVSMFEEDETDDEEGSDWRAGFLIDLDDSPVFEEGAYYSLLPAPVEDDAQ